MNREKLIKNWLIPALIAIAVFAVFNPSLKGEFLNWDDLGNTVENLKYRAGWGEVIKWSFTSFYREHFMPVSWIIFAGIYKIWGLYPFGYHLISLIFHITTAIALYFLALKLIKSKLGSLFAALFFALQPLRVEAVSWVSAWAYPICGFFSILTILSLSQIYRIKKNPTWRSHRQMAGSRSLLVFFDISIFSLSLTLKIHRNQFTGSFIYT